MCKLLRRYRRLTTSICLIFALPLLIWLATATWRVVNFHPEPHGGIATLLDTRGRLITTLGARRQPFLPYQDIPQIIRTAIVDIEDVRFWQHPGVDPKSMLRALWTDIRGGAIIQGASTITQQIAKLQFLTLERTFTRKIQEMGYALLLEARFSKEQLLAIYLNTIYFGEGAYGVEEAALTYFNKSITELTLAEVALLVGLPKAPSTLSPFRNPTKALARREVVLNRMAELGHITPAQAREAADAPLQLARRRGGIAPYFADHIRSWLEDKFGDNLVRTGGLRIYTTLDIDTQTAAVDALNDVQGSIVALDPRTGAIRAMVGGRDYIESQFNRATQALRQPGSAFKPIIYACALENGWQMNQLLNDNPHNFSGYQPKNFKDEYWNEVTMKQALVRSLNNASVWLLHQVGVNKAIEMSTRLGISTLVLPDDRNLALALGGLTKGVTPLDLAAAYMAFANQGVRYEPYAVEMVVDNRGNTLFRQRPRGHRVLSEETAYFVTNMLQAVIERGTGTAANIGRPAAGKTGTTNDSRNAWFIGYTPQLLASVYVGNDDNSPLPGGGSSLAAPIWGKFALQALRDTPAEGFRIPVNVVTNIPIDIFTGLLANDFCQLQERDAFATGQAPRQAAPCYFGAAQPQPYQLASQGAQPSATATATAVLLPEEAPDPSTLPTIPFLSEGSTPSEYE